jgi:hypothetical protein
VSAATLRGHGSHICLVSERAFVESTA